MLILIALLGSAPSFLSACIYVCLSLWEAEIFLIFEATDLDEVRFLVHREIIASSDSINATVIIIHTCETNAQIRTHCQLLVCLSDWLFIFLGSCFFGGSGVVEVKVLSFFLLFYASFFLPPFCLSVYQSHELEILGNSCAFVTFETDQVSNLPSVFFWQARRLFINVTERWLRNLGAPEPLTFHEAGTSTYSALDPRLIFKFTDRSCQDYRLLWAEGKVVPIWNVPLREIDPWVPSILTNESHELPIKERRIKMCNTLIMATVGESPQSMKE